MDPRFLQFYLQELAHVRDSAAEFAQRFPKIAARLGMEATEVKDPYVERLLEGFAFLAARVQLRLHEEFPRFTEQLLNRISPHFLAPVPSMGVVQFNPDFHDPALKKGVLVKAGTLLQSQVAKGIRTACRFAVAHDLALLPLELQAVSHGPLQGKATLPSRQHWVGQARSALQVRIHSRPAQSLSLLPLHALDFHICCSDEYAYTLFDRLFGKAVGLGIRPVGVEQWASLPLSQLQPLGFENSQSLLPSVSSQFSGSRLLQEFFSFPDRFLFFRISGLDTLARQAACQAFELAVFFSDNHPVLDGVIDLGSLALNCTPVVNLFPQACDRLIMDHTLHELHLQPSRVKPQDFEIYTVLTVQAHAQNRVEEVPPLFSEPRPEDTAATACYTLRRTPSLASERQVREGGRTAYTGSEVYLALTRSVGELHKLHGYQQLQVTALCSNRDLPLLLPLGQASTDLTASGHLPVQSIRFLRGPSRPRAPLLRGHTSWQLVQHLSVNYLGLTADPSRPEEGVQEGGASLGQLLGLYADPTQPVQQQIARAVHSVKSSVDVQRIQRQGRPVVVRGLHVELVLDESALQGVGLAVLGLVLSHYLAAHVSVNSFIRTTVRSMAGGQVIECPARTGCRPLV